MNEKFSFNEKYNNEDFIIWKKRWGDRLKLNNNTEEKYLKLMHTTNPLVIPRNHMVEEALAAANNGDIEPVHNILKVLEKPYTDQENISIFQNPNPHGNEDYKTFCGT
jgi:uncharacterized protein YdiU (UPF0061 family)